MPRPDPRRPREGQQDLFEPLAVHRPDSVPRGRHSEAMDRAIAAGREAGQLDDLDDGLATVLRAGATALDMLEAQNKPYGPAKLLDPMVAALREARMTPDSRQTDTDDNIKDLLDELARPDDDATVSHATDARQ